MPNGKPGDHPYTDIVVHRKRVYSEAADDLVRRIASLASQNEREQLAEMLLRDYNEFCNPDISKLERLLTDIHEKLISDARKRGWEVSE